jgi:hypothetical protein
LTFDEFKRAVEEPDPLEAWLDQEPTFKLGCLAPALRIAIQAHQASISQECVPDPALDPLLILSELDDEAATSAVDASLQAIKKQLLSKQRTLRHLFRSKSRALAKRSEFVFGQMQVGTIRDFYLGLQGRVGKCII